MQELISRGYDITTLKVSVQKFPVALLEGAPKLEISNVEEPAKPVVEAVLEGSNP